MHIFSILEKWKFVFCTQEWHVIYQSTRHDELSTNMYNTWGVCAFAGEITRKIAKCIVRNVMFGANFLGKRDRYRLKLKVLWVSTMSRVDFNLLSLIALFAFWDNLLQKQETEKSRILYFYEYTHLLYINRRLLTSRAQICIIHGRYMHLHIRIFLLNHLTKKQSLEYMLIFSILAKWKSLFCIQCYIWIGASWWAEHRYV